MVDSNKWEDDRRKCLIVGLIVAAIVTAILIWILALMGVPVWLLVILGVVIAVGLFYLVSNYCQDRAEAAADASAREVAERAAAERAAAEERATREAAEAAEARRRRADAEAREAAERAAAERAAAEERATREAAEAAEAQRRRADAEAREATERAAAERVSAEQTAVETARTGPAAGNTAANELDRDGDGVIEGIHEGTRPAALAAPRGRMADDLKKIKGIGAKLEQLCNQLGFYHFDQIAAWTLNEVAWVDSNLLTFKGRVTRDNWVEQARVLASGGET